MGDVWLLLGHVRQQRHYPRSSAGREQPLAGAIALSVVLPGCLGHTMVLPYWILDLSQGVGLKTCMYRSTDYI